MPVGRATLDYATAQPLCRLAVGNDARSGRSSATYVFLAWPGIPAEFSLVADKRVPIDAAGARVKRRHERVFVDGIIAGTDVAIQVGEAGDVYFEGDRMRLSSTDPSNLQFGNYPDTERSPADFHRSAVDGVFQHYAVRVPPVNFGCALRRHA